jgi:hypothetical protein
MTTARAVLVGTVIAALGGGAILVPVDDARALVVCQKRKRTTLRASACKRGETAVNLDAAMLQGLTVDQIVARAVSEALAAAAQCAPDAVKVGPTCVDRYEASVWSIPADNTALVEKVKRGTATAAELIAGGAVQHGCTYPPFLHTGYPGTFPSTGNWTEPLYAVSVAGVLPSACVFWFQAVQACASSGKRLLTNEEWQRAAAGTPDPDPDDNTADCEVSFDGVGVFDPVPTGSRANCVSRWGVFDVVGNVGEWVGDWSDASVDCTDWMTAGIPGGDGSCFGGPGNFDGMSESRNIPGALKRGGSFSSGATAGVFSVDAHSYPAFQNPDVGFRCAR